MMNDEIRHEGRIESIQGEHLTVRITQTSACLHCKIAGHCNSAESKEKLVDVWSKQASEYAVGQTVVVTMGGKVGLKAVFLAFVVPVVIALCVIWGTLNITSPAGEWPLPEPYDQGVAALAGMLAFIVYYVGLYFFRDKLRGEFRFRLG